MTPFDPGNNSTIEQPNAITSAGGVLPETASTVVLTNTSATATAYFTYVRTDAANTTATAVIPSGSTRGSMPILPNQQIRITVNTGPKAYATIASAANGSLLITPGDGN